ncbi:MAG TPA: tail fiber domain-containing protein [Acidobacteriota bacterium]|nr:tail fiber domain-containing protein [Acidobacteriota bacterium]
MRYKSEVETVRDAVGLVSRLRGVSFVWKETGKPSLGLIAEEAAEVIPELVETNEQTQQAEAINYAALTALLIEAVKEQQERIRSQEERTEAQQAQIQSLQAELAEMQTLLSELLAERVHRSRFARTGEDR